MATLLTLVWLMGWLVILASFILCALSRCRKCGGWHASKEEEEKCGGDHEA